MIIAITVIGKDRPGIIAGLSGALYQAGGNLEDASMTILEGQFAMIFLAELKSKSHYRILRKNLGKLERRLRLVLSIREIRHRLVRGEKHRPGTIPWVVSVSGQDRAGIVYQVSKLIASQGLNITDLNSKIMGTGPSRAYALILEVDIPKGGGVSEGLKRQFKKLERTLGVTIVMNPIESSRF